MSRGRQCVTHTVVRTLSAGRLVCVVRSDKQVLRAAGRVRLPAGHSTAGAWPSIYSVYCACYYLWCVLLYLCLNKVPDASQRHNTNVLEALESGTTRTSNNYAIYRIHTKSNSAKFQTDIQGNEIADPLANAGHNNPACCHYTLPHRDSICFSKTIIANSWNGYWVSSGRSFVRTIKTTTPPWRDHPSHQDQRIISRLRVGYDRIISRTPGSPTHFYCKSQPTNMHFLRRRHHRPPHLNRMPWLYSGMHHLQLNHSVDTILSSDVI